MAGEEAEEGVMAEMNKDWKYVARVLLFIPAGLATNIVTFLGLSLIGGLLGWMNPPDEFGESFLEGGLIYAVFGTELGRNVVSWIFHSIQGLAGSILMIIVMMQIYPVGSKRVFNVVTIGFIAVVGARLLAMLWYYGIELSSTALVAGQLVGVIALRYAWRDMAFDE
jgi:hypothetical protein